jgi:hypothetical protein
MKCVGIFLIYPMNALPKFNNKRPCFKLYKGLLLNFFTAHSGDSVL